MKCIFIYNPQSGRGKIVKKITYIEKRLHEKYDVVDIYATKAQGDLTKKVREVADQYDCIIFSGGDGTFNEVLKGVGDRAEIPCLGYIPNGTANDVAHSLKIPRGNVKKAIDVILTGKKEMLDCMCVNGEDYAMYSVSAGAFTSSTYSTPQVLKKKFGKIGYGLYAIKKNFPLSVFPVKVQGDDNVIETENLLTLVINGKCVAGWKMNKNGSMQDGKIECAVVKQQKKPNFFTKLHGLFAISRLFLFGYNFKESTVDHASGKKLTIDVSDDVVWNYDGEKGRSGKIVIEVLERKVPLLVPKNNKNI